MSTPRQLELPVGVAAVRVATSRGVFAAILARPAERGIGAEASPDEAVGSDLLDAVPRLDGESRVLMLPGWTGSKEDFATLLTPLAAAGHVAVAVDLRGQYETPGGGEDAYSMESYSLDVLALRVAMGPGSVHLLGHSFGGLIAQRAVVLDPSAFASVILLCSGPAAVPEDRHPLLRLMAQAIVDHGLDVTYDAKRAHDLSQGLDVDLPDDVEAWLRQRFLSHDPSSLRAMTLHLVEAADHSSEVADAGVPALVAFGSEDDGWPLEEQRSLARTLGRPPCVIPQAGHSPAVETPQATADALTAFLAEVQANPA